MTNDFVVIKRFNDNYRAHPVILKAASEFFYNGKLVSCAPPTVNELCNSKILPKKGFPMMFCAVEGEDMREGDSPSFFNV